MGNTLRKLISAFRSALLLGGIFACGSSYGIVVDRQRAETLAVPSRSFLERGGFIWGIQGHPGKQAAYAASGPGLARQLDYLDSLHANYYRIDLYPDSAGDVDQTFGGILDAAAAHGIEILPVLIARPDQNASEELNYRRGYGIGFTFASRYRGRFTHVEAGNELDNPILRFTIDSTVLPPKINYEEGSALEHYVDSLLRKTTGFLRGMTAGIHHGAPGTGVVINAGYKHYAFFEALHRDGVPIDVYGYHWYSNMGDFASEVLPHLPDKTKDIWLTEANWWNTPHSHSDPMEQARWIARFALELPSVPRVKALFIYELYEERAFGHAEPESYYGIVGCSDQTCSGPRVLKPGFHAYQYAIRASRQVDSIERPYVYRTGRTPSPSGPP